MLSSAKILRSHFEEEKELLLCIFFLVEEKCKKLKGRKF